MEAVKKEEQRMYTESGTTVLFSQGRKGNDETASKCSFCKKLYHTEAECVAKHLYLKPALEKRLEKKRANRQKKRNEKKKKDSVLFTKYSPNQEENRTQGIHRKFVILGHAAKTAYDIVVE